MKKLIYLVLLILFSMSIFNETFSIKFKCPTFSVCCRARGLNHKDVYNYSMDNSLPFFELFNKSKNDIRIIASNDPNRLLDERYIPIDHEKRAIGFNKDATNKSRPTNELKTASEIDNTLDTNKDIYIRISYRDSSGTFKNKVFKVNKDGGPTIYLSFTESKLLYPQTSQCGGIGVTESFLVKEPAQFDPKIMELTLKQLRSEVSGEQPSSQGYAGTSQEQEKKTASSESIPMPTNEIAAYRVLELPKGAPYKDVKKSFRRLQLKWHPDKNLGRRINLAEENTKSINRAHEILMKKFGQ